MIRCTQNDWRYYGESQNVSGRLASHRSLLNKFIPIICCKLTITNMNQPFWYIVLFMGPSGTIHYSKEKRFKLFKTETFIILVKLRRRSKSFWGQFTLKQKKKISEALTGRT
jgi:hypothetical protein